MTIDDLAHGLMQTTAQAASEVVANVFNATPGPFRPVALASLRVSVDAAVATMAEDDQAAYAAALERLTCMSIKKNERQRGAMSERGGDVYEIP